MGKVISPPMARRRTPRVSLSLDRSGGANPTDAIGNDLGDIVARFRKTGTLPHVHNHQPLHGDFTFGEDLHEVREAMFVAQDNFMALPALVREAADNDWVTFLDMFDNRDELKKLQTAGLKISTGHPHQHTASQSDDETQNDDTKTSRNTETDDNPPHSEKTARDRRSRSRTS